jgi:hypothetical protein
MGIAVHQMAGVNSEDARKEFKFPEDYKVHTAIALGHYGGELGDLPSDDLRKQEQSARKRMPQEEFTFEGDYVERADTSETE